VAFKFFCRRRRQGESPPLGGSPPSRGQTGRGGAGARGGASRGVKEERIGGKSDVICSYYMQGKCQKTHEECFYSHHANPPRKMELW